MRYLTTTAFERFSAAAFNEAMFSVLAIRAPSKVTIFRTIVDLRHRVTYVIRLDSLDATSSGDSSTSCLDLLVSTEVVLEMLGC